MFECKNCGKEFRYFSKLSEHLNRKKPCDFVQKVTDNSEKSVQKVTVDVQKVTVQEFEKNIKCNKCGKTMSTERTLKRHVDKCNGMKSLQCPKCLKVFTCKQNKYTHMKNVKCKIYNNYCVLKEEIEFLKKENAFLKASKGSTINNNIINQNITNYVIKYDPETKCLTTDDPKAPIPELLCFNGFQQETTRTKLKDIDEEVLQKHIDNVRNFHDYFSLYIFFFRNVDNRRLHMFNLGKNNNATYAQVFNNGNIEKIEKTQLFENVSKYIGQYLLNLSTHNIDVIGNIIANPASKKAFIEVIKDKSNTFEYFRELGIMDGI